jgi:uncharacterized protein (UPF0212 family)
MIDLLPTAEIEQANHELSEQLQYLSLSIGGQQCPQCWVLR